MTVIIDLNKDSDLWPQAVVNFSTAALKIDYVQNQGIKGINLLLTELGINAKMSHVARGMIEDSTTRFRIEFDSQDDYTEFTLRWG